MCSYPAMWVAGPRCAIGSTACCGAGTAYFGYGTRLPAYRAIDNHVYERVRRFLVRRHKVPSHGTNRFPREAVFGALGVLHLRRVHVGPPPCASQ
jgi:RNA-directed DNA polymerase